MFGGATKQEAAAADDTLQSMIFFLFCFSAVAISRRRRSFKTNAVLPGLQAAIFNFTTSTSLA